MALWAAALAAVPAAAVAQRPSLLVGGGLTSPIGDFKDVADGGYHLSLGVQMALPSLPVGVRLDGSYHRLPAPTVAFEDPRVLGGALDVVFDLPGEGLVPYMLIGVGRYRIEAGALGVTQAVIRNGFQGGFGVNLGTIAFGGFAEIRYVQINGDGSAAKYIPLTIGVRM